MTEMDKRSRVIPTSDMIGAALSYPRWFRNGPPPSSERDMASSPKTHGGGYCMATATVQAVVVHGLATTVIRGVRT